MKSGKRFIGCSSYPDCKTGFPLPQTGLIEPLKQNCARCGKPMIVVRRVGRVFRNCIDMNCKSPAKLAAEAAKAESLKAAETKEPEKEEIKAEGKIETPVKIIKKRGRPKKEAK